MKSMKKLLASVVGCAALVTLAGCDAEQEEPMIWDFAPVVVQIEVVDKEGHDLFDPGVAGNIAEQPITITCNGVVYEKDVDASGTRAYRPWFRGLYTGQLKDRHVLCFGELDATKNHDMELVVDWGDGSRSDVIRLEHKFYWRSENNPVMETLCTLNGTERFSDNKAVLIRK